MKSFIGKFNLQNRRIKEGYDGFYLSLNSELGVKILKSPSIKKAQDEYLINLLAYDILEGRSSLPIACGQAKIKYPKRGYSNNLLPIIWMHHINGVTAYDYALNLGIKLQPQLINNKMSAFSVGWNSSEFVPILKQMDELCKRICQVGMVHCKDHHEQNFIIEKSTGIVKMIDFSAEKLKKAERENLLIKYADKIHRTYPDDYLEVLQYAGLLI